MEPTQENAQPDTKADTGDNGSVNPPVEKKPHFSLRILKRLFIIFFTHERDRNHHWGVTIIGIAAIAFSIYWLLGMSNKDYGPQIICHAAMMGDTEIVVKLLEHDHNLHNANVRGASVLHWAVAGGSLDTVKALISHGAPVNAVDHEGVTPLHIASIQGFSYIAEYLVKHGAKVNAKDKRDATPLDWAEARNQLDVVKVLREHGGIQVTPDPFGEPRVPKEEKPKAAPPSPGAAI